MTARTVAVSGADRPGYMTTTVVLGTPTTGLWCDACGLPGVVTFPLNVITPKAVWRVGNYTQCVECGTTQERMKTE